MNSQIDLQYLVGYCKQLPTFRDALPIMMCIKDWGIEHRALDAAMQAEREVREHFRSVVVRAAECRSHWHYRVSIHDHGAAVLQERKHPDSLCGLESDQYIGAALGEHRA